jgi:hypothetical protein
LFFEGFHGDDNIGEVKVFEFVEAKFFEAFEELMFEIFSVDGVGFPFSAEGLAPVPG